MKRIPFIVSVIAAAAWALAVVPSASGQTSPALLLKPWEAAGAAENTTTGLIENEAHVQENGDGFQFSALESEGRLRLFPGKEASPRLGYDVTFLNAHTSDPKFPHQLLDASVAAGSFVGIYDKWVLGATLGLGYSGSGP
jgi:hypothetical protein